MHNAIKGIEHSINCLQHTSSLILTTKNHDHCLQRTVLFKNERRKAAVYFNLDVLRNSHQ